MFVCEDNSTSQHARSARNAGVVIVESADFLGYASAALVDKFSIPSRYLVARFDLDGASLYVHNVFAPVNQQTKQRFFAHLNAIATFEGEAGHFVMGDFNILMDPTLGANNVPTHSDNARLRLATLGGVDAWRVEHDSARVYTEPQPRKNRLDYILLSDGLFENVYKDFKYFVPMHAGDHPAHSVIFRQGV